MRVLLSTIGSGGDVQPLVALALERRRTGRRPALDDGRISLRARHPPGG